MQFPGIRIGVCLVEQMPFLPAAYKSPIYKGFKEFSCVSGPCMLGKSPAFKGKTDSFQRLSPPYPPQGFSMIFRRTNDLSTSGNKPTTNNTPVTRREPEVNSRGVSVTPSTPTQATPLSPIAMAQQARRTGNTPSPANSFNRNNEQLRKLTVGRDISLNGEITTCDHLIVEGNVTATIKGGQVLEISETGTYSGLVDIEQADIAGTFDGELTVRGKLTLRPTAVVTGLIRYGRLQVDSGAILNGQLGALPPAATETATNEVHSQNRPTDNSGNFNLSSVNDQPGFLKASA